MPMQRAVRGAFRHTAIILSAIGKRTYFARDIARGLREPGTWAPETIRQMQRIGVESVPLAVIVAAFLGGVTAFQTRYQLFPGVQLSVVGLIVRQSIVLELGPLLTALVLTGRVGARMTAEIGTMRVTEQIDALETLSFDPVAYLALPRLLAALVMIPALTVFANLSGVVAGWLSVKAVLPVTDADFIYGAQYYWRPWDAWYSVIKAFFFAGSITIVSCYMGFNTQQGAEGVGRATTGAVVASSVLILLLDVLLAQLLLSQ